MNKTTIFIALFVILSAAIKLEQVNTQLKQIESSKFGRNILDMVQLQLTTSDGVDTLVSSLDQLHNDLKSEQQNDTEQNDKLQGECHDDQVRLSQEIEEAQQKSSELQSEIDAKTPVRDQKVIQLAENENLKVEYSQQIVNVDQNLDDLEIFWATVQDDHQRAGYTLQRAKDVIVGEFQKGSSFLQNKQNINFVQLSKHLSDSAKKQTFQKKSWNKLFKVLSQITASAPVQADAGAIQKIVELFDELLAKLEDSLSSERQAYNHQKQQYNEQRASLVEHLQQTQANIDNLNAEIHALNSRLDQCHNEKSQQDQRAQEKSEELEKRTAFCDDQQQQYDERSKQRDEQLRIVTEVIDIINSNLRVLKKYVGERED